MQHFTREEGPASGSHQSQRCFGTLIDLLVLLQAKPGTPPLLNLGPFYLGC